MASKKGEKSINDLRWIDPERGSFDISTFEYWSQLCFQTYFSNVIRAQPTYRITKGKTSLVPPHILCVVGPIGSGKSEATKVLCELYDYKEVNSGHIVAELVGLPPLPETPRANFQTAVSKFLEDPNAFIRIASAICTKIKLIDSDKVLINGIRQVETLNLITEMLVGRKVAVIFVHTPPNIAFTFYKQRENNATSIDEFLSLRNSEDQRGVEQLISISHAVLYNWNGRFEYHQAIKALMNEVLR